MAVRKDCSLLSSIQKKPACPIFQSRITSCQAALSISKTRIEALTTMLTCAQLQRNLLYSMCHLKSSLQNFNYNLVDTT
jgi:hypothetical protein